MTDWADREFTFDWTDDGQLEAVTYPNGVVTSREHDVAGQVTGMTTASASGMDLLNMAYGYSDGGLLTDRAVARGTEPAEASSFTWDGLSRVDSVSGEGAGDVAFDAAGSVTLLPDGRAMAYDDGRQLTSMTAPGAAGLSDVTTTFTYDGRGNRLTSTTDTGPAAGTVAHTFDLANRLTSLTATDGDVTSYAYDGNGLRTSATSGGDTETFVWDVAAGYPLLLVDGEFAYVYGPSGVPLAQESYTDGAVDYLHTDQLGSVVATTDAAGSVTSEAAYDLYGVAKQVGSALLSSVVTRFGIAGEYTDHAGYVYLRARYYDPVTAQFVSVDPLVDLTGSPYGYTAGNPLQFSDPLGLWPDIDWGGAWDNVTGAVSDFGDAARDVLTDKEFWSTAGMVLGGVALVATAVTLTVATGGAAAPFLGALATYAGGASMIAGVGEAIFECRDGGPASDCAWSVGLAALPFGTGAYARTIAGTAGHVARLASRHVDDASRAAARETIVLTETAGWSIDAVNYCW